MTIPDRDSVFESVRAWLVRTNPAVAEMSLAVDTDIIESRILESLQVVEFILFLEQQSGRTILSENLNPNTLRTMESIYRCFFEGPA